MIAGTNGAGVKLSDNAGASWEPSYYRSGNVYDSFTDPSVGEYFYFVGNNDYSVRVSNSSRLYWNPKNSGFNEYIDVYSLTKASDGVYYAGTEIGIYKTSDAGGYWALVGLNNIKVNDVLVDISDRNIIWAATQKGLYRSTNNGANWGPYSIDWLVNKDILTLEQIPGTRSFYIGTNGGNFYYFSP
jgi:ligand-binding sensor domain-containing protein